MKTLKSRLTKEIKNLYLATGDDFYLFEKAKEMIINSLNISLPDLNVVAFDDDNFNVKNFIESCESFPLGDQYRCIVLKGVTKLSENDKKELLTYLQNISFSTVVIILDYSNKFEFLKKYCELIDTKRMDNPTLLKLIAKDVGKFGKTISAEAGEYLINSCNGYLTKIENEIEKLVSYSSEKLITKNMVDELVIKDLEYTSFELTEALSKRDGDRALILLSRMEKEPGVLTLISNYFRRMFFIAISDMPNVELAKYLGVKEYAIIKAKQNLRGFSKNQLRKINSLLEEVDYSIKSGAMQNINALYYLVFNILYM